MGEALWNGRKAYVIRADKSQTKSYFSCQDLHWTLFLCTGSFVSSVRFCSLSFIHLSLEPGVRELLCKVWPEFAAEAWEHLRSQQLGGKTQRSELLFSKNHWKGKSEHTPSIVTGETQSTVQGQQASSFSLNQEKCVGTCRAVPGKSGAWPHGGTVLLCCRNHCFSREK